jgi:hypothetical protein
MVLQRGVCSLGIRLQLLHVSFHTIPPVVLGTSLQLQQVSFHTIPLLVLGKNLQHGV